MYVLFRVALLAVSQLCVRPRAAPLIPNFRSRFPLLALSSATVTPVRTLGEYLHYIFLDITPLAGLLGYSSQHASIRKMEGLRTFEAIFPSRFQLMLRLLPYGRQTGCLSSPAGPSCFTCLSPGEFPLIRCLRLSLPLGCEHG